jgi:ABC-type branched-subunit amino acid transport system ATPase component
VTEARSELTIPGGNSSATGGDPVSHARLACVGVTVRFGGLVAVHDVDLEVPPGAIVGLVGPNGAGKSTLFGVLSGLIRPWHGKVLLDGEDVTRTSPQVRAARGLARTFQHPELFTGLSVRDHLVLARRAKRSKSRIWADLFTMGSLRPADTMERADVDELIELLGLGSVAEGPVLGLPLGLARLVELGRALATSPTVLLLDEPSSGLDSSETEQFATTLRNISRDRGISILLVEHDVELVMRLSSTVYVLDFGVLIARDSPDQVRADPAVRAAYLGEEISGNGAEVSGETPDAVALSSAERDVPPSPEPARESAALVAEGLSVRYGDAVALTGVSFQVGQGKALAVLGANGAGKSTLARALSGLVPISKGKVVFDGEEIDRWPAYRIRRAGLVHLPEGRGVFRGLSVIDNLRLAAGTLEGRQARHQAVELALEIFPTLAARRNQRASLLSGGEQQMLSLARVLATSPKLLVADEMSLGLAPRLVDVVFDGLNRARQTGVTVIMIEQYVHRALEFADACLVLQRGSVAWSGPARAAGNEVLSRYLGDAMTAASS